MRRIVWGCSVFVSVLLSACAKDSAPSLATSASSVIKTDEIVTQEVVYGEDAGKKLIGYVAYPKGVTKAPVVLVVHEWWGQTSYPRMRAEMLAKEGFVAMAIDMYGDRQTAEHPDEAKKFMTAAIQDLPTSERRFKKAMDYAKTINGANPQKMAAIGYCFGGGVVLHMARQGFDLAGVASFHGPLATQTPAVKGKVKAKLAVFNGAADPMITASDIDQFKKEMKAAEVPLIFINYPNAVHAFTNPDATAKGKQFNFPLAYNLEADSKSWVELQKFLQQIF